mmetsp:Transcript_1304/g.4627  ORF Transcript_1304/g.4627 Transcript_1304/m.4627 type:complete len:119 (+) Transcript_1304:1599-1955(+)
MCSNCEPCSREKRRACTGSTRRWITTRTVSSQLSSGTPWPSSAWASTAMARSDAEGPRRRIGAVVQLACNMEATTLLPQVKVYLDRKKLEHKMRPELDEAGPKAGLLPTAFQSRFSSV